LAYASGLTPDEFHAFAQTIRYWLWRYISQVSAMTARSGETCWKSALGQLGNAAIMNQLKPKSGEGHANDIGQ
jgi:hypothetical protein